MEREAFYVVVTADRYELPVATFDTINAVASWAGRTKREIYYAIAEQRIVVVTLGGLVKRYRVQKMYDRED